MQPVERVAHGKKSEASDPFDENAGGEQNGCYSVVSYHNHRSKKWANSMLAG